MPTPFTPSETASHDIVVIGGGAAGFFGAITAAEARPGQRIVILEKGGRVLTKVAISGGGRCNVTHACFEPAELVKRYPRGSRELRGPFTRWNPRHMIDWFASRGVPLKTENDGRMFPATDQSATIVGCLREAARDLGVTVRTGIGVRAICAPVEKGDSFTLTLTDDTMLRARKVLVATGGLKPGALMDSLQELGHAIEPLAPSLFTFNTKDARLRGLSGVSVPDAHISVPEIKKLAATGPVLVTHWGLSGPGILKLSAWGARALHALDYKFAVRINWLPGENVQTAGERLRKFKQKNTRRYVHKHTPVGLPLRLWASLAAAAGIPEAQTWATLTREQLAALAGQLAECEFAINGKSMNKEEFVTCGGIALKEVDFKTMQSKRVPGLHFAGETLDIDGITGGFNFQAAWTTARLAGLAMAG